MNYMNDTVLLLDFVFPVNIPAEDSVSRSLKCVSQCFFVMVSYFHFPQLKGRAISGNNTVIPIRSE